jgi:hypothetical protein
MVGQRFFLSSTLPPFVSRTIEIFFIASMRTSLSLYKWIQCYNGRMESIIESRQLLIVNEKKKKIKDSNKKITQ